MPFIDCKLTLKLSEEKREAVKAELGRAVSLLHKSERYLMVGFAEGYELYMAAKNWKKERMFPSAFSETRRLPITKK